MFRFFVEPLISIDTLSRGIRVFWVLGRLGSISFGPECEGREVLAYMC